MKKIFNNIFVLTLILFLLASIQGFSQGFTDSNLPIVIINTNNSTILDDPKVVADMKIISNPNGGRNNITDQNFNYNGKIGIELRGSPFSQNFPKKSYGIELRTTNDPNKSLDASILGMNSESDWVLNGSYYDPGFLRNAIIYDLFRQTGRFSPNFRYCELVLNGQYIGLYMLIENIKRNINRVNITKLNSNDTNITGGYIVEVNQNEPFSPSKAWQSDVNNPSKTFEIKDPKNPTTTQLNYIKDYFISFGQNLKSPNFADPVNGFRQYVDENSFVDWIIFQEFSYNNDAYHRSQFFHKDRDKKIVASPQWDFDNALGSGFFNPQPKPTDKWIAGQPNTNSQLFWPAKMLEDCSFKNSFKSRYISLRSNIMSNSAITGRIDQLNLIIQEAKQRDWIKWSPSISAENISFFNNNRDINVLKSWILARLSWMDANIDSISGCGSSNNDLTENGQASDDGANNPANENEVHIFDNDQNTKWLVFNPTGNIAYDFAGNDAFKVIKYSVTSANDEPTRDPKNWNFQGSNDGITWATINSQTNQFFGNRFEKKEYSFTNLTAYKLYRLNVTANNGASLLQIAEIQMFGDAGGIENPPSNTDLTENGQAADDGANNPVNEGEVQAFDNNQNTKWLIFNSTGNISYDFNENDAYKVVKYSITSANDDPARDPKSWNFQGSNDGTTWITVNSQANQLFGYRFEKKEYSFTNSTVYKLYRLNVTANNGASLLQIAEIQMFGSSGTGGGGGIDCPNPTLGNAVVFHWDVPTSTIWFAHRTTTGNMYVSTDANPATPALSHTQLRASGVAESKIGCFLDGAKIRLSLVSSATTTLQPDDVTLSPNPNNGIFKVNVMSNAEKEVELLISNKSGKILTTRKVKLSQGSNSFDFKISEMEGLYILNVVDGNVRFKKQIAKIEE